MSVVVQETRSTFACDAIILYLCNIANADNGGSFEVWEEQKQEKFFPFCSWSGEKHCEHAALTLTAVLIENPSLVALKKFFEVLPRFTNLSSIRFNNVLFSPELINLFSSAVLPIASTLKRLHFSQSNLQNDSLTSLFGVIRNFVNLERFSLSNNHFGHSSIMALVNSILVLSNTPQFTHFILSHNNLKDDQMEIIVKQLKYQTELRNIDFSYNNLTSKALDLLAQLLGPTSNLNTMILDGNMIGTGGKENFKAFSAALAKSKLAFLSIAKNGIANDHFKEILRGVEHKTTRISLDLRHNLIGDGIEALGNLLHKPTLPLYKINLHANSLANTGLTLFASKLRECRAPIHSIDLSKNNIPVATASLLLQASVSNSTNACSLNLEDNPECKNFKKAQKLIANKIKGKPYAQYLLVTLAILGSSANLKSFHQQFTKSNIFKQSKATGLLQLAGVFEKRVKEYFYSLHYYEQEEYLLFGRLLRQCFRVSFILVADIKNPKMISELRSWVPLIDINTEESISIIFAVLATNSVSKQEIEEKEHQIHDLITELCFQYPHIQFSSYPMILRPTYEKQMLMVLQSQIKGIVDSNPVYLPKIMLDKLLPIVKLPKVMRRSELMATIRKMMNIDAMDALLVLQNIESTNIIIPLSSELICLDPRFLHNSLFDYLTSLSKPNIKITDGSEATTKDSILETSSIHTELEFENIRKVICSFLCRDYIWFPLCSSEGEVLDEENISNLYFLPQWLGKSVSKDKRNLFRIPMDKDKINHCILGRRLVFGHEDLPSHVWYTIQARFYEILTLQSKFSEGWSGFFAQDCLRYTHTSGYSFRLFFQMEFANPDCMRLMEIHAIGKRLEGVICLLNSISSELHIIFLQYGYQKYLIGARILRPKDMLKWNPKVSHTDSHAYGMSQLLLNSKRSSTLGDSVHMLIPDILEISPEQSLVNFRMEEEEIHVEITVVDIQGNLRSTQDEFQVFIISGDKKCKCTKYYVPGNSVLMYSYCFTSHEEFENAVLVVTLIYEPVTLCGTPVAVYDKPSESAKNSIANWKRFWEPTEEIDFLKFCDPCNYIMFRDKELHRYLETKKAETARNYEQIIENVSPLQYLQICTDATVLADLSYTNEPKEYVSKHIIQRSLNNYTFRYLPDYVQKYKVFHFAPPVDLWLMSGKSCFFTFERGGDLYICIRGTKTSADILADLKYSLTPYKPCDSIVENPGKKKKKGEKEMIHNGFSRYAEIVIQRFRESYSELLATREKRRLFICGHSLGGGIAQVIARKMLEQSWNGPIVVCTFGSPLIGNTVYCNWKGWRTSPNLKIFNFANQKDPVTNLLVRSWSVFSKIGVAPKLDFGYTAKQLFVFSCNTSTLEVKEHDDVIPFLQSQVAWNPKDLKKYIVSHTSPYYASNIKKLLEDFLDPSKSINFTQ